ncbi:MFS general substrate transporter [Cylindrobasidium torrendii FP15055 ss-10]|uniref:MFS general substrate transporter n=1 Tax=Cylindrobasidium torrendii FP15055 ss-10 TaxID=1314674 RepID=A0A0D7BLI9_9AGAR|nr:MFS general substrate transporter [Cylindrobasidium torrendii FP15055 ss-10]
MAVDSEQFPPSTRQSSVTQLEGPTLERTVTNGHGESALPADKVEDKFEREEDDWQDDPRNPRNWKAGKKWIMVSIVSMYTFVPPLASSMMAPGLPIVAIDYGITNETVLALTLSIFLLSFGLGPLFLAPLSEMYGRTWVLHIGNLLSLAFSFGCAYAPDTGSLIGFRFLAGLSGSAPIACGAGTVGDLFSERDRASAMAMYTLGPLIGPVVGPIAGGFVANSIGAHYVFVIISGLCAVSALIGIPFLRETYAPIVRARLAKNAGDVEKAHHVQHPHDNSSKIGYLWVNLSRPVILLTRSFVCLILSLYMAFMYGIYYLMFATFPTVFRQNYGFGIGVGGLVYIGLGVGFCLATIFASRTADQVYHHLAEKNGGVGKPEHRIPALFIGSLFVPIGLFWYGWSAQARIHWMMPIVGSGIFGFGMMTTFIPIQLYLVDTFTYAASAVAAASVLRSLFGFAFPLFAGQMFKALGLGGGNSLLGGLAIVLGIPFPIWVYYKGEAIRAKSSLTRK